ncbi:Pkinase-domain-containing protein [Tothia fuscella]|uniref:non-specific serine/threonine protein kinase n=1 Tax=Tothia fuscella TaxID=1048955 RepID=A0A9P4TVA1_9PEZI|nr:Pkinase-domain-containing protein [Tothia fuscella]
MAQADQTVRFASVQQEYSPDPSLQPSDSPAYPQPRDDISPETQEELKNLSMSLQRSRLQTRRLNDFAFDPVSLPVSRVPSNSSDRTQSELQSSRHPSDTSAFNTPPLTPAASGEHRRSSAGPGKLPEPSVVTPQISPPHEAPPTSIQAIQNEQRPSAAARARLPISSGSRPRSVNDNGPVSPYPRDPASHAPGSIADSLPASNDGSPTSTPRPGTPGAPPSGTQSPSGRPLTPGELDNPYARSKRAAQERQLDTLDAKFVFGREGERPKSQHILSSHQGSFHNGSSSSKAPDNKRLSIFGGGSGSSSKSDEKHHGNHNSMSELKRFFKFGGHKKDKDKHKKDKESSSSEKEKTSIYTKSDGTRTPPSQRSSVAIPFADDHGLESKYGKFGKMLGSGAGGSVRLMKRGSDGTTFAVKQFRDRHSYESERDYNKKVTAEFCIGSTLHHGNIIETMDIIHEKGKWYEVMEYAPYDLFAIVMTGKMSREEVSCATLQILSGLTYLHSMGLAHRDMKLDNVVVNEHGIMKIIDFGSAVVFKYPFEDEIVLASGIVGSDPYLAPEVYDVQKYDPQPTDIWSLAIMFCCMTLRRFPWKAPRTSDNSYKLFVSEPTEEERRTTAYPQTQRLLSTSEPASRLPSDGTESSHQHYHHSDPTSRNTEANTGSANASSASTTAPSSSAVSATTSTTSQTTQQPAVIKGPWRLLRLLPRETRHIIGRMLELDPNKRATLDEIVSDPWVLKTPICQQEEGGTIFRAEGHTHTLEPGSGGSAAPSKK